MAPERKPNLILITFDSGRPDHMGIGGYAKKTTPFLDSLAEQGIWFENAYATGPGSSVSFVGMFTSTYPLDHGGYGYIDRPRVLLSEVLQKAGYRTIGIHSSPYLSDYFGYGKGWDTFKYVSYFKKSAGGMSAGLRRGTVKSKILKKSAESHKWFEKNAPAIGAVVKFAERLVLMARKIVKDAVRYHPPFFTAEKMNEEAKHALEAGGDKPVFFWMHYLDAHAPYGLFYRNGRGIMNKLKFHASELAAFLFGDFPRLHKMWMPLHRRVYDESLAYLDRRIQELFGMLREKGVLNDDAVVIIHADHGEEFLEHGSYGHMQRLYNVNVRVPLMLYSPKYVSGSRRVARPVSLIDVAPTLIGFAAAEKPETYRGVSLLNEDARDVIIQASESAGDLTAEQFTGSAIVCGGYKYMKWKEEKHLFALADREEANDLIKMERGIAEDLEKRLAAYDPKELPAN